VSAVVVDFCLAFYKIPPKGNTQCVANLLKGHTVAALPSRGSTQPFRAATTLWSGHAETLNQGPFDITGPGWQTVFYTPSEGLSVILDRIVGYTWKRAGRHWLPAGRENREHREKNSSLRSGCSLHSLRWRKSIARTARLDPLALTMDAPRRKGLRVAFRIQFPLFFQPEQCPSSILRSDSASKNGRIPPEHANFGNRAMTIPNFRKIRGVERFNLAAI